MVFLTHTPPSNGAVWVKKHYLSSPLKPASLIKGFVAKAPFKHSLFWGCGFFLAFI
ncbi:dynein heavy chain 12, axonemal [Acetobacter orientalis]|uniref:Dynein heavy chain 12, axonemal n=1 Tax=Acetobacter orientalis TaxID=146474 RepID=A0A2Z5ZKN5_9PROT|nr:dynein heavy chain 12, axonemal [Acetobacter orientalis]